MKNTIKEVQEYFVRKITSREFDVEKFGDYCTTIVIDNEYKFEIWTANGYYGLRLYSGSFMYFELKNCVKKLIWDVIYPKIKLHANTTLKEKKMQQYNKLKKELNL